MALFSRKTYWEKTFRLRSNPTGSRKFLGVLFWIWGIGGLIYNVGTLASLSGSVGVGTSAYLTATALVWIGGMLLFGIGALILDVNFDGERQVPTDVGDVNVTQ